MRISFPKMEYERRYASVVFMRFGCELLILCEKAMLRKLLFVLGNVLLIIEFPFSVINTSFLLWTNSWIFYLYKYLSFESFSYGAATNCSLTKYSGEYKRNIRIQLSQNNCKYIYRESDKVFWYFWDENYFNLNRISRWKGLLEMYVMHWIQ